MRISKSKIGSYSDSLILEVLIERLAGTPPRLHHKIMEIEEIYFTINFGEQPSLKETIGQLLLWEETWQQYLHDILHQRSIEIEAHKDYTSQLFNAKSMVVLLRDFKKERGELCNILNSCSVKDLDKHTYYEETGMPLRILDLLTMIAENDDFILYSISRFKNRLPLNRLSG